MKPQDPATQVALPCAGAVQGSHRAPHEAGESSRAQSSPQRWEPASHTSPQVAATQVALPLAGTRHRVHDGPHPSGEVPSEQASPQRM